MYLQRIELQGFKSFATKTIIEMPPPGKGCEIAPNVSNPQQLSRGICGTTAIIGPNGSGKSNIVDAVRWVLGEQSLKLLRGKKSTDVIFSGSAKKSQMGLAEVSLHLNNEDHSAPIDYSEIVITRRIYRDGASEYLLNKSEVRLFDILMLLAKANFGQNTYSIIGQGMIDRIVNYSSLERKEFFDEATGIKQFQLKRDRSVGKLKRSRENLEQAKVLINELEPHLKSLTRQVNKLRQRQQLEAELRQQQLKYYGRLWRDLSAAYEQYAMSFNTWEKQRVRLDNKIIELQQLLDDLSRENSRSEEFDRLQQEYDEIMTRKNNLLQELVVIKGKLELEYNRAGKQNLAWLENKNEELGRKAAELEAELKSSRKQSAAGQKMLTEKESALKLINDELSVWQNNLSIMQEEFYQLKSGGRVSDSQQAVRAILGQREKIRGLLGSVAEIGRPKKSEYEAALVAAAGSRINAVVVDSDETAAACIDWLKQNRAGTVTFFPLNKIKEHDIGAETRKLLDHEGVAGLAKNLLNYDKKFQDVFSLVFGSTIVIKNIEAARALGIGRERMATLGGDLLEKTGAMRGGYRRPEALSWAAIEGRFFPEEKIREIAGLKAKLEEQQREKENLLSQLNDLKVRRQIEENKISEIGRELVELKQEKSKVMAEIKESQLTPEEQSEYFNKLKQDKVQLEERLSGEEKWLSDSKAQIGEFNQREEEKKREVFSRQQEMHNAQNELNQVVFSLNEVKVELAKIETKKDDVYAAMKADLGEDYSPKIAKDQEEINPEEAKEKIEKLRRQLDLIGGLDPEIEKEYEEVKTRSDFLTSQSNDLERAIKDLEKIVVELDKIIKDQFEEEFKKINKDFYRYFKQLFDGGSAKLVLAQKEVTEAEVAREELARTDLSAPAEMGEGETAAAGSITRQSAGQEKKVIQVEDQSYLVNMGIEIEACPPGKKIKNISMLSGGEKTMTALALICAIIYNNPSPFILFDEVDAALDENNSFRLGEIVSELSHKTQFIIITHNRAIMARGDVLYGVTMQGDGVSRLLSLKLSEAEKITKEVT